MVERKIYSPWAFTTNEFEKRNVNYEIYETLKRKYKIKKKSIMESLEELSKNYDIIYELSSHSYGFTDYTILKNKANLSASELALIVDNGNLCFGYHSREINKSDNSTVYYITIYTD